MLLIESSLVRIKTFVRRYPMNEFAEQVLSFLRGNAPELIRVGGLDRIFLFGSLLRDDAELFHKCSDIDLLLVFADSVSTPATRATVCHSYQQVFLALQANIAACCSARIDVSVGIVSHFEFSNGINTRGEKLFGQRNDFLDLISGDSVRANETPTDFVDKWQDALHVLQETQSYRKRFLSAASKTEIADNSHTVPKETARAAARLCSLTNASSNPVANAYDFVRGGQYLEELLSRWRVSNEEYATLDRLIAKRRSTATLLEQNPLTETDRLLLWEILAFEAEEFLRQGLAAPAENRDQRPPRTRQSEAPWRSRPIWVSDDDRRFLRVSGRTTWWWPIEGNGSVPYRPDDIQVRVLPLQMELANPFVPAYEFIKQREQTRPGGATNGQLLALADYHIARSGDDERPLLELDVQRTPYYYFLASSIDPLAEEFRARDLAAFAGQPFKLFPNAFGLCMLVRSSDDQFLFGIRSRKGVALRPGESDVSVVEGLNPTKDIVAGSARVNLWQVAKRAADEEMAYDTTIDEIELLCFGVDLEYYQWLCLGLINARDSAEAILERRVAAAKDRYEYNDIFAIEASPAATMDFLENSGMWSSGIAATYYALRRLGRLP